MTQTPPVILTAVTDRELSGTVDRVAAAIGARTVRAAGPNRRSWLAAAAVVLDAQGAAACLAAGLPRRDGVIVVAADTPPELWATAVGVGAQRVCVLPAAESELVAQLAEVVDAGTASAPGGRVIAVVPARGGAGASVFSGALALSARAALLVDLDPCGGGIDLLVGSEGVRGLRWPDVHVHSGRLGWAALRAVLPRRSGVSILSGGRSFHEADPGALTAVVDAGRRAGATVICDVSRQLNPAAVAALRLADLVAIVTSCDVRAVAATAATVGVLRSLNPALGLVVRGPSPGGLRAREVSAAAAVPLLASQRPEPRLDQQLEQGGLRLRPRSPLAHAARTVLGVAQRSTGQAA